MKAAILTEFNTPVTVQDVPQIPLGPKDALVRVDAAGVCHSDLTVATGGTGQALPLVMGHEGAGTVLETGSAVTAVKKGDRVIAAFIPVCGHCWFCVHGHTNLCDTMAAMRAVPRGKLANGQPLWTHTGLGTMAEVMTVDESMLVRVETDLPAEQLALIGCGVTTGVGAAINTAQVEPGSSVAVIGCGGVGQSIIQGARIAGAARIFAVDPVELKRQTALKLGATDGVNPKDGDPVEQVRALTGGRGADYTFEALGLPETIVQAYNMARRGGTATIVGMARADATITLPAQALFRNERRFLGSYYGSAQVQRDFPRLINLVESGRLDVGAMVSRRIAVDGVNEAFRAMEAGEVIRSVITW
ncbi:MAG TPA: Zn-dependent alcohol dehydrogenase [Chloroflexota bacterium]|nr:Zn-dependent alcohol dehydrogenase [Chloroflexota bacterium]